MKTGADNKKIFLLADDDADDRELFCEAISSISPNIISHCAEDGKELLNHLSNLKNIPDLIFLDLNMPVMDGWECLKELKNDKRYRSIPIIIYSTSSLKRDIDTALKMGALGFVVKPGDYFDLKEVLALIANHFDTDLELNFSKLPDRQKQYLTLST